MPHGPAASPRRRYTFLWFFLKVACSRAKRDADFTHIMPPNRVAVPAISFGQHPGLVRLLRERHHDAKINTEGVPYYRTEQHTIEHLQGYDVAIVSLESINERVLSALPEIAC
jgi:D-3-phosphoglycerate dehydrogenase